MRSFDYRKCKNTQNDIKETREDGTELIRFTPVPP